MYHIRTIATLLLLISTTMHCQNPPCHFTWNTLAPIPDSTGFAGSFAGVSNGALIVAGGSNFPGGGAPWKGTTKKWYDKVFALESESSQWKEVGKLPIALGYGVSITTNNSLIIIGGSNEKGHVANVWRLQYANGSLQTDTLPSLPFTLANTCGAIIDDNIYVAGGLTAPDSPATATHFLVLNLSKPDSGWRILPTWPGPSRMLAVAGVANNTFYLFSGTRLVNGVREYLKDAYAYTPDSGWKAIASLPQAVVAAPTPAYNLQIFGGDDGILAPKAMALKEKHPGFSKQILQYDAVNDQWQKIETIDSTRKAPVTTPMVVWNDQLVFPGGEVRPATRTPNVLSAKPCAK